MDPPHVVTRTSAPVALWARGPQALPHARVHAGRAVSLPALAQGGAQAAPHPHNQQHQPHEAAAVRFLQQQHHETLLCLQREMEALKNENKGVCLRVRVCGCGFLPLTGHASADLKFRLVMSQAPMPERPSRAEEEHMAQCECDTHKHTHTHTQTHKHTYTHVVRDLQQQLRRSQEERRDLERQLEEERAAALSAQANLAHAQMLMEERHQDSSPAAASLAELQREVEDLNREKRTFREKIKLLQADLQVRDF
jgi:hypothetical protein